MDNMSRRKSRKNLNPDEDEEERQHFNRIVSAFSYYGTHSLQRVQKTENYLNSLPVRHQSLLKLYRDNLQDIKRCIERNQRIIQLIIKDVAYMFESVIGPPKKAINRIPGAADLEKVQATLKQFVRDWSKEGEAERLACYQPIIDEIVSHFPLDKGKPSEVKVLVPGAGLGRLAFEIARRGYTCQGNEFSLFMLFASNFVLNRCKGVNAFKIYPWIHQFVNNLTSDHQTDGVSFPDINPADLPLDAHFSMAAGDFLEVYCESNEWNCIATCFFIDCANNVVSFIEAIFKILKPGGIWVNLGPLLYHFSDIPDEDSIEPSYEVLREVIENIGFTIEKEKKDVRTSYAQNPHSMLKYEYGSVFFVCRKPLEPQLDSILDSTSDKKLTMSVETNGFLEVKSTVNLVNGIKSSVESINGVKSAMELMNGGGDCMSLKLDVEMDPPCSAVNTHCGWGDIKCDMENETHSEKHEKLQVKQERLEERVDKRNLK